MKKKILSLLPVLIYLLVLTSCACRHQWTAPSCTSPATCSLCGATEGDPIGHSWLPATCTAPQTCEICGETQGDFDHNWRAATCFSAEICEDCKQTRGEPLGHTWQAATCLQPKTCLVCGVRVGSTVQHDWLPATKTAPMTCSVCGITVGDPAPPIAVGDIITMGYYGGAPIEWIILEFDPETSRAMLISKYCLDAIPYHAGIDYGSWENCTLRKWLNSNFIETAFTPQERATILDTQVFNTDNPEYGIDGGNSTFDQIFLLSYAEVIHYFPTDADRQCRPTAYCLSQGCYDPVADALENDSICDPEAVGYTWWWLRTPGIDETRTCNVVALGFASTHGALKISQEGGVRPVMWVQLG